jgi:hypothetical protein
MNDLLGDVRPAIDAPAAANPLGDGRGDLEAGTSSAGLQAFFTEVDEIKRDLADIKQLQGEVEALHQQGKTIIKSRDVKAHQEVMQNKVNVVNKLARSAKGKIDALDKENKKAKDAAGQAIGSAEMRTRTNVTLGAQSACPCSFLACMHAREGGPGQGSRHAAGMAGTRGGPLPASMHAAPPPPLTCLLSCA